MVSLSPSESSLLKGESTEDTVRTVAGYCDVVLMRHPTPGMVERASRYEPCLNYNTGNYIAPHFIYYS